MSAARRSVRRRTWPRGLYEPRPDYYVWRHPNGMTIPIGRVSLQAAKAQACAANLKVEADAPSILEKLERRANAGHTVRALLEKIPKSKAENTQRSNKSLDKRINAAFGDRDPATLDTPELAKFIEAIEDEEGKARLALAVRSRLNVMAARAQQLGWMKSNPVTPTRVPNAIVKRKRLTLEAFMAVREKADQLNGWLGKAMDLALVTGCDRDTIAGLDRRKHIVGDWLEFERGKTKMRIAIPLDLELVVAKLRLRDVVRNTSGVASRYLVHHVRNFGNAPAGAPVHVNTITRQFTAAYELTNLPRENAPTFHEIRSLAKRLYREQGNVDTKELLGHRDDRTANLYADPRGIEALRVTVKPLPANKHEVNSK